MWPTRDPKSGRNYDLANSIKIRAGAHAFEAKAFNIVVSSFMDAPMRELFASLTPDAGRIIEQSPRGVSVVIGPSGEPVSEILANDESLLYAEIDTAACVEPKQIHDVVEATSRMRDDRIVPLMRHLIWQVGWDGF